MTQLRLRIELLGHVRILDGGTPVAALASARRCSLLAYLILHRHVAVRRERLASLFWPDSEEGQARTNLRRELHHLRADLPCADEVLRVDADTLQWVSGDTVEVDVEALETALEAAAAARSGGDPRAESGALERAAVLYRGDLLPASYDDWLEGERQRLRCAVLAGLERLVGLAESSGDTAAALAHAERLLGIDPAAESAYRALMRLHQRDGNRAAAIHAFHRCAGALQRELEVTPSDATRAAYEALLATEGGTDRRAPREARDGAPLVGRDRALATLAEAWVDARAGASGVVVVYGEAGIGKTRLVEEFVRHSHPQQATVARSRAYAAEGTVSYGLAVDWLRTPAVSERVRELPAPWRAEIARLAPELDPEGAQEPDAPDTVPASWQRRRLLEAIARALLAAPGPRLLIADDLQWADADSLDVLRLLTRLDGTAQLLILATARSEELPGRPALERLLLEWRASGRLRDVELGRLSPSETERLARDVAGGRLSAADLARIVRVSEGVPLFVVEALLAGDGDADALPPGEATDTLTALPPRVRAVLSARLQQLSPAAASLAELAATIGRAFRFEVLRQASDRTEEELVRALDELWRRRIVREQAAGAYDFSHDALRDAARQGADPARRRLLHRRVARALEHLQAEGAGPMSGRLAHHFEQGGEPGRAVHAYRQAAREAGAVYAHGEAVRLLDHALELVAAFPPSEERDRRELELHLAKSIPIRSLGGYTAPTLDHAMRRARELSERLGDLGGLNQALRNQQNTRFVSGRLAEALELSERLQALARDVPDRQAEGDHAMAGSLLTAGDVEGALRHFERAEQGYDPATGRQQLSVFGADLGVFTAGWRAHALWLAGFTPAALAASERGVAHADELGHAYSQALAHAYGAALDHMRRDRRGCLAHARTTVEICETCGFAYYVHWGRLLAAWADASLAPGERVTIIEGAIAGLEQEGAAVRRPFYLTVLAQALSRAGDCERAREALAEAERRADATDESWWAAEIARLQSRLAPTEAARDACLHTALVRAERMSAWPLAARSALTWAQDLRGRGQTVDAARVLERVLERAPAHAAGRDLARAARFLHHLRARERTPRTVRERSASYPSEDPEGKEDG